MNSPNTIDTLLESAKIPVVARSRPHPDEFYFTVGGADFVRACHLLHKRLESGVMTFFAEDLRAQSKGFALYCGFLNPAARSWVFVSRSIEPDKPVFDSLAKEVHSAGLFEREIREMFGLEPAGHPDPRSLRLHEEVWPRGYYPLRKDFVAPSLDTPGSLRYPFKRVEGEGIFEIPVGPVHAGVIGPGHFRFSVAGEPIINLETRLGWTHRGLEKLLEGKTADRAVRIFERISGDTAFGYSLAFCRSVEKIAGIPVPPRAQLLRVLYLELERMYNHAGDVGGIALDVGFGFPAQFAGLIKETILRLNEGLSGSRYLKGINAVGGTTREFDAAKEKLLREALAKIQKDFSDLQEMLFSSISFMDRVDAAGVLRVKTARDLGVTGLATRSSGIALDMRKALPGIYDDFSFELVKERSGDAAARLKVRCREVKESMGLIRQCLEKLDANDLRTQGAAQGKAGAGLGCVEAWRGPVLVWTRLDASGKIERCKIVDASFHNWEGLTYAVLGNIVPDFPLCNKSFDLSYPGNDL